MAGTLDGNRKRVAAQLGVPLSEYLMNIAAGLKRCRACKTWKPNAEYALDSSRGDGRKTVCYGCARVPNPQKPPPPCFKGRKHSPEARALMSRQRLGNRFAVGHVKSPAQLAVSRDPQRVAGARNPRWKGGVSPENHRLRGSAEYAAWRLAVFARDCFACRCCGDARGGNLRAHHVKPFATHPDLRFDVDNGLTLCEPCHELEHRKAA